MSKHRFEQIVAIAALGLAAGAPAAQAQEPTLDVAASLHARAVVDTTKAERLAERSSTTARRLVVTSTKRLERSARIVARAGAETSGRAAGEVSAAQVALSASAAKQGDALARIADDAKGQLKTTAIRALARVASVEASVSAQVTAAAQSGSTDSGAEVAEDLATVQTAVSTTGGKALRGVAKRLVDARRALLQALRSAEETVSVEADAEAEDGHAHAEGEIETPVADAEGDLDVLLGGGGR